MFSPHSWWIMSHRPWREAHARLRTTAPIPISPPTVTSILRNQPGTHQPWVPHSLPGGCMMLGASWVPGSFCKCTFLLKALSLKASRSKAKPLGKKTSCLSVPPAPRTVPGPCPRSSESDALHGAHTWPPRHSGPHVVKA